MRSVVRVYPGPPYLLVGGTHDGAIAQLGERLLCKQDVVGSIPSGSTKLRLEWIWTEIADGSAIGTKACETKSKVWLC